MSALACCAWCGKRIESQRARQMLVELRTKSYTLLWCDDVCKSAYEYALDFKITQGVNA